MAKSKISKGFYPLFKSDLKRMVGYCETWGYGNKDTCKYVAENAIEQMCMNHNIELTEEQRNKLNEELIGLTHDYNSGGNFGKLLISM